jgi:general secretion pathway protein A
MDVPVFSVSPNPTCMYLTQELKDAVIRFRRAIARKQGLCVILGGNGMGKSSLLRYLSSGYEADEACTVSYFADSRKFKTSFDFLKMISADFGIAPKRSQTAQMDAIEEVLVENHQAGKTTMVFIDEAQRLNMDSLELVRALLNYETNTEKLVQVVLSGQLELRDRLQERKYKAFRSRIVAPHLMQPLTAVDTAAMIRFRLESWGLDSPFTDASLLRIHELSGGVPRDILMLCQQSYDRATDHDRSHVEPDDVEVAFSKLQIDDPEPDRVPATEAVGV